MGKYDTVKYSKVEDRGAQDVPPSEGVEISTNTGRNWENGQVSVE